MLAAARTVIDAADSLVEEQLQAEARRDRPPRVSPHRCRRALRGATVGLDIGGTKVLGVVLDADGTVVRELRRPSPVIGARRARRRSAPRSIDELDVPGARGRCRRGRARRLRRPADLRAEHPRCSRSAAARRDLRVRTGRVVVVDNDANVAALCEHIRAPPPALALR